MLLEEEDCQGSPETPPSQESRKKIDDQNEEKKETEEKENKELKGEMKENEETKEEIKKNLNMFEGAENGVNGEEEEVRYSCASCGKHFKFLTYLKGHQSSKANCNSKEIKKKRQSMNVSRLDSF